MIKHSYEPDPRLARRFLHLGDEVTYQGTLVKVESINLTENSTLDGVDVPAAPWCAASMFTVTLSNGKWAYGEQITQLPEVNNG